MSNLYMNLRYNTCLRQLPKDLINLIYKYCTIEYPILETICFSWYHKILGINDLKKLNLKIHNHDDFVFQWICQDLDVRIFGVFIDFCYHKIDIESYKKLIDVCKQHTVNGINVDDLVRYQLLSKPYNWNDAEEYV